jgi:hypothetical protein
MFKSVEGIYEQGEIKLQEMPDNIPQKTKVIVTFLNIESSKSIGSSHQILTNEEIDLILESYRQKNKVRPRGLCKGEFITPDNFNEPLPDEILDLFEGS